MAKVSGIYVIVNTKNGKVYVGQAQDFHTRWCKHKRTLNSNRHDNRHLQSAWNKYGAKVFRFQKLEYCSIEILDEREQHYLDVYMPKGMCYNIDPNVRHTRRGTLCSEETRRKLSNAAKTRPPVSEETRRKLSEASRGRTKSEETRRKLSEAGKGRKHTGETCRKLSVSAKNITSETRRKMSEAAKKRPPISEETRCKLSNASKNRSEDARRKMSEASKKRPFPSEEARRKMSEANKNISEERRRKLSEAATLRHARRRAEREALAAAQSEGLTP